MSAIRDVLARRRQELNPLTTSVGHPQHQLAIPSSAVGMSTQLSYNQSGYTPASAVRDYNPQQWSSSSGNTIRYSPSPEGGEVPPPYSPPRSNRPVGASLQETASVISQAHLISPAVPRPSPEASSAPVFPPPPPGGRRGASRDRPQTLFNLGFSRRAAPLDTARLSPDINREHSTPSRRVALTPISVESTRVDELLAHDTRPPASKRAASTGAIGTPSSSRSRSSSTARWEPGMPLPPPPPGPPPQTHSRSQSMTRTTDVVQSPPTRRPAAFSTLGPVPPTPADWVDEDANKRPKSPNRGLQIDTTNITVSAPDPNTNSGSSSSGLVRNGAVRGESKSIRERRSESRSERNTRVDETSNNPWAEAITPSDITVPPATVLGRRPIIAKTTPRSGRSFHADTPGSAKTGGQGTPTLTPAAESRGSTPRPINSSRRMEAPTPPFSPDQYKATHNHGSPMVPPKSLPTPPPQTRSNAGSSRPSPQQYTRSKSELSMAASTQSDNFTDEAIQRHRAFSQREASASTDEERVRLFADFIVTESRIRRQRYAAAIDAMGSEILELTRDLFRPYAKSQRPSSNSFSSDQSSKKPLESGSQREAPLSSHKTDSRPASAVSSTSEEPHTSQGRPESQWWTGYMPSLSPIESVSQSQVPDESSSRGRTSSRWWEVGQEGSGGSPTTKFERSKRESKYMGMPKELRESLQWQASEQSPSSSTPQTAAAGSSNQMTYGPNEYPPEKVGWHDGGPTSTPTSNALAFAAPLPYSPAPLTPNTRHLDVSRLVTLPPPYPRHHPAVNNNHPDLTDIRTSVRSISDFREVEASKTRFTANGEQRKEALAGAATRRRLSMRASIQREIEAGVMTYADAAKAEADFTASEYEKAKEQNKASFDLFQTDVVAPLNDLLMDRIQRATTLFEKLQSQLFVDAQKQSPNATQEEGDEQPELLEKLTLLKWIFEAREQLHRELFELLSDRNDRYKDMVTSPYRLAGNEQKALDAERFFATDAKKRKLEFANDSLSRVVGFMDTVETNVVRGVEVQLSAFWDIAPPLRKITEKVPLTLTRQFMIQIPNEEYEENPSYYEFPLQYFYTLLEHGEKSTYQFIESQINLLCLLHEVKSAVASARGRVDDAEADAEGRPGHRTSEDLAAEVNRLTDDLKEKVRCIEELWSSALGQEFEDVKRRVRDFLIEEGGWEGLQDQH
ncbi:MAG: hypothetical protein M1818_001692 [Claussenomyces sp. TS43310]|nr:MAG: hypothetical protein M1818_001692 [Claussenomyces sp. TS43310]